MDKLIKSACMAVLCVMSNYPERKIPVMGFCSVLRFYDTQQIASIASKVDWFTGCAALYDDLFTKSINAYDFIQIPAHKETLDLLYHLVDLPADHAAQKRLFLLANSYRLEELARAVYILAYHYLHGNMMETFGVVLDRDYRGVVTWHPNRLLSHFGWSKIELINDQLVIIPYDSHFVAVIDCSGNSGAIKSYSK
jgi:hypothetical protein